MVGSAASLLLITSKSKYWPTRVAGSHEKVSGEESALVEYSRNVRGLAVVSVTATVPTPDKGPAAGGSKVSTTCLLRFQACGAARWRHVSVNFRQRSLPWHRARAIMCVAAARAVARRCTAHARVTHDGVRSHHPARAPEALRAERGAPMVTAGRRAPVRATARRTRHGTAGLGGGARGLRALAKTVHAGDGSDGGGLVHSQRVRPRAIDTHAAVKRLACEGGVDEGWG